MDLKRQAQVNTLKTYVVQMSMFQAKLALMMLLEEGSDPLDVIDYVYGLKRHIEKDLR